MSSIPAAVRSACWKRYNGETYRSPCYCCGSDLAVDNWHAGHVLARVLGGSVNVDNLRPICQQCNTSMGSAHMRQWAVAHGLRGRIVSEPEVAVPLAVPAEHKTVSVHCRGCRKERTAVYLAQRNGYCATCFEIILRQVVELKVPTGEERELVCCVWCAKPNAVVRK